MPSDQFIFEQEYLAKYIPSGRRSGDHMVVAMVHASPQFPTYFEKVFGRLFICRDCKFFDLIIGCMTIANCVCHKYLELSDKTREIINHIMREGDDLGIDVHPQYYFGNLAQSHDNTIFFIDTKKFYPKRVFKIQFKLKLIL